MVWHSGISLKNKESVNVAQIIHTRDRITTSLMYRNITKSINGLGGWLASGHKELTVRLSCCRTSPPLVKSASDWSSISSSCSSVSLNFIYGFIKSYDDDDDDEED